MHTAARSLVAGAIALFALWTLASSQQAPQDRIEYRQSGYFPKGYPLHGTVKLLSAPVVEAGKRERVRIEYTVGDLAVEPGMAIEIWKHFTSDVEEFQVSDANAPAWFGAQLPASGVKVTPVTWTNWEQRNTPAVFPYRKTSGIVVESGALKQGDRVVFDLGGARGVRMQYYEENLFNFRVAITRKGLPAGYGGDAILRVVGGPLKALRVMAPSVVKTGEAFPIEVAPMDEWVSQARNSTGLALRMAAAQADVRGGAFRYEEPLLHYAARDARIDREGTYRIAVETTDGRVRGVSNPVWVEANPLRRAYYGEMHQHTYLHDGRGVFDELYRYGRRVGLLDFGSVTPHHMPLSVTGPSLYDGQRHPVDEWPALKASTKKHNGWQEFVSISGYEYSVGTQAGGHHNVFYNADDAKSTMELDPKNPMAPVGQMLETVKLAKAPTLVIPHIGGGPPDWSHPTDQRIERLFEIASVHGVFEDSWRKHLENGLRQGVIGAGDTHTTSMGIAYPGVIYVNSNALAGVWALAKDRQSIWDGLYERRTFATTGNARMMADFRVNGEGMGGEIGAAGTKGARIEARVSGTAPLLRVELVRNGRVIHATTPARAGSSVARIVWGDNVYQRRAATGLRKGSLRATSGRVRLIEVVNRDQGFETFAQKGAAIEWESAAVSGDRDGVLVDLSEASGDLHFRLDDSDTMGLFETTISIEGLKRDLSHRWVAKGKVRHPYMQKMGVDTEFTVECDLVDAKGRMDERLTFEDREPLRPGDYIYLRAEQLDTNKLWTSPVWVN
ncbi:MAG: DUF3604 domain-containing protein [Bryobacteraceae bacterium]